MAYLKDSASPPSQTSSPLKQQQSPVRMIVDSMAGSAPAASDLRLLGLAYSKALAAERHKRRIRHSAPVDPDPTYTARKQRYCNLSPDLRGFMHTKLCAVVSARKKTAHLALLTALVRWQRRTNRVCSSAEYARTHALVALMARRSWAADAGAKAWAVNTWRLQLPVQRIQQHYRLCLQRGCAGLQKVLLMMSMRRWMRTTGGAVRTRLLTGNDPLSAVQACSGDVKLVAVLQAWHTRHSARGRVCMQLVLKQWQQRVHTQKRQTADAKVRALVQCCFQAQSRNQARAACAAALSKWQLAVLRATLEKQRSAMLLQNLTRCLQRWNLYRQRQAVLAWQQQVASQKATELRVTQQLKNQRTALSRICCSYTAHASRAALAQWRHQALRSVSIPQVTDRQPCHSNT